MIKDEMTSQEVFDHCVLHMRQQGRASRSSKSSACLYRSPEGLKCVVGSLIRDEEYDPSFEQASVESLMIRIDNMENRLSMHVTLRDRLFPHLRLLKVLQKFHDVCHFDMGIWEFDMQRIAQQFGLTVPPK